MQTFYLYSWIVCNDTNLACTISLQTGSDAVADPGFPRGGGTNSLENCMKLKEFGPPRGRASLTPSLDPPLRLLEQLYDFLLGCD